MTRPTVLVSVTSDSDLMGPPIHEETRGAWNAALRASEAAVREAARNAGVAFEGADPVIDRKGKPAGVGSTYTRVWTAVDGSDVLRVKVERTS